jgi:hypothetical protein
MKNLESGFENIISGVFVIIYLIIIGFVIYTGFDNTLMTPIKMFVIMWLNLILFTVFGVDAGKYINRGCDKEKQPDRCDAA